MSKVKQKHLILENILQLKKNFIIKQLKEIGFVNQAYMSKKKYMIRDKTYPLFLHKIKKKFFKNNLNLL